MHLISNILIAPLFNVCFATLMKKNEEQNSSVVLYKNLSFVNSLCLLSTLNLGRT